METEDYCKKTVKIDEACEKAEELVGRYNPDGVSPFPFDKIIDDTTDLKMYYLDSLHDDTSGVTIYDKEEKIYVIFINKKKHPNRQHFTAAHEMGHYFLHKDFLLKKEIIIDGMDNDGGISALFRLDNGVPSDMEREANNFAASLIMPSDFVINAWKALGSIEECAKIFNVSASAMSIRLERLKLIN